MVIAWIWLSTIGFLFALFDGLGAYDRWRLASEAAPEDARLIDIARSTMLIQLSNVVLFCIMLVIGLLALVEYLSGPFPWLMFSINFILVVSTIEQYRFRKRMYRRSDRDESKRDSED